MDFLQAGGSGQGQHRFLGGDDGLTDVGNHHLPAPRAAFVTRRRGSESLGHRPILDHHDVDPAGHWLAHPGSL